jgi:hypothetical protein
MAAVDTTKHVMECVTMWATAKKPRHPSRADDDLDYKEFKSWGRVLLVLATMRHLDGYMLLRVHLQNQAALYMAARLRGIRDDLRHVWPPINATFMRVEPLLGEDGPDEVDDCPMFPQELQFVREVQE